MVRADAEKWTDSQHRDSVYRAIDRGVGGVGVFKGTVETTAEMIVDLQKRAGGRLLIGADYEHGLAMRLEGAIAFPRAMALGKTSPGITEHIAIAIADEARSIGVHWNWAPVADINSDPRNPIINVRSFGDNPETVSAHVSAYVRGLQSRGVIACVKHLPGHGDTHVDSHLDMPRIDIDKATAEQREFAPFRAGIAAGVKSVMVGHILVPFLDDALPASLSARVIQDLIRTSWGFDGVVCTDALDMRSVTQRYSAGDTALMAARAGVDVILMPSNTDEAITALAKAVDDGLLNEEEIEASLARVAQMRAFATDFAQTPEGRAAVDQPAHALMALKAADAAMQFDGDASLLPIVQFAQVAAFAVVDEHEADTATAFFHYLAEATELNIDFGFIDGTIESRDLEGLLEGITQAECVIFAFFGSAVAFRGRLPGTENIPGVMDRLTQHRKRIIIACGNPYGINDFSSDLTINTFSDTTPSLAAAVLRLIGRTPG